MSKYPKPARVTHPGEILRQELESRGWTQAQFAQIIGRPALVVNQLIKGKRDFSPETAAQVGAAFDEPATFWLNLQSNYKIWRTEQTMEGLDKIAERARLAS